MSLNLWEPFLTVIVRTTRVTQTCPFPLLLFQYQKDGENKVPVVGVSLRYFRVTCRFPICFSVTLIKEEATAALHQARRLTDSGRTDRALKLFRRALEADPSSPDVLTQYGNFIEMQEKNIIRAQQMYAKALAVRPDHTEAQTANERILPLVEEKDHKMFEKIDWKRGLLSRMPVTDVGFNRARRENYFLHVYHTLAIEGNTMTLSMTRSVLETGMAVQGKSLLEHNEVQGLGEALHFINQSLLYKGMIDLDDVLTLHLHVFGHVQPSEAGRFRSTQVFVGDYHPPPPENVPPFMKQFGEWLESREARTLHPIARAALDHYKLVWIHPFMDGNGRTARLLMNVRLMQNGYPPIIIKLDERHKYYQYLTEANEGDVQPFVRFIARITERAIDDYLNSASDSHLIPDAHSTENIVPP